MAELLLCLLLMGAVAVERVVAAAVVTLPFIKRQMVLGLVEGVLQLGDAPPPFATRVPLGRSDDLDRAGRLEQALWLCFPVVMPQVLLPDVVLVQIELVVLVVVVRGRGNVPLLGVAAVLGADRARGRFVVELVVPRRLILARVRDQLAAQKLGRFRCAQLSLVNRHGRSRWGLYHAVTAVPRSVGRWVWLCFISNIR